MKKTITTIIVLLFVYTSLSQQIILSGQVTVHNSKYNTGEIEYVENASIIAPFTKPAATDVNGNFQLEFVGVKIGASLKIQVEKSGYEIVNSYDLQDVVIGRKLPLRVFLAPKGQLAKAQTELYNISRKALFENRDAIISRLKSDNQESKKAIEELEKLFSQSIKDREEAEHLLLNRISVLEEQLFEYTEELSMKNLDFANEFYIEAYEHFKNGKIDQAIKALDKTRLDAVHSNVQKNLAEAKKLQENTLLELQQLIDSYALKASAYYMIFDYANAADAYEEIISLYTEFDLDHLKMSDVLYELGLIQSKHGLFEESFKNLEQSVKIKESLLDPNDILLGDSYFGLAMVYRNVGDYQNTLNYLLKTIEIEEAVLGEDHINVANDYSRLGDVYRRLGIYDKAESSVLRAIEIINRVAPDGHPDIAIFYFYLASTYLELGEYENALEYQLKATELDKDYLGEGNPGMAYNYENLALIYIGLGEYDKAESFQQLAIDVRVKMLRPEHPYLTSSYAVMANIYMVKNQFNLAISFQRKAIRIAEKTLVLNHPDLGKRYYELATILRSSEQYSEAVGWAEKSLVILKYSLPENHPLIAKAYINLSWIQLGLQNRNSARDYSKKAVSVIKRIEKVNRGILVAEFNQLDEKLQKK